MQSSPSVGKQQRRIRIPRTWKPEEQGMLAGSHHSVTTMPVRHSPSHIFQSTLGEEAEKDFLGKRARRIICFDELRHLITAVQRHIRI